MFRGSCETLRSVAVISLQSLSTVLNSSVVQTETPNVVLEGLRPGTGYAVQVRARTVAGYGVYSREMLFQTLTDGECECMSQFFFTSSSNLTLNLISS